MDVTNVVGRPTIPEWPIIVEAGTATVVMHNGQAVLAIGPGKYRRDGSRIPFTGEKKIVVFNTREIPISHRVDGLTLSDGSIVAVELGLTIHCTSNMELLRSAVDRYSAENLPVVLSDAVEQELRAMIFSGLRHLVHRSFVQHPDLRSLLDVGSRNILGGLLEISFITKAVAIPDPNEEKTREIRTGARHEIQQAGARADVDDFVALREQERQALVRQLDEQALVSLARLVGVPYWYLKHPDTYEKQLELHTGVIKELIGNAKEMGGFARQTGLSVPEVANLLQGILPPSSSQRDPGPLQALPEGSLITRSLNFNPDLDEVFDEMGLREMVSGSSIYVDVREDTREVDAVVVSLDPGHVRAKREVFSPIVETRMGVEKSYWHFVPYEDDLKRLLEVYWAEVLPSRFTQDTKVRVIDVRETGRDLIVRVSADDGRGFEEFAGQLYGKGYKRMKQLKSLLPYRDIKVSA